MKSIWLMMMFITTLVGCSRYTVIGCVQTSKCCVCAVAEKDNMRNIRVDKCLNQGQKINIKDYDQENN